MKGKIPKLLLFVGAFIFLSFVLVLTANDTKAATYNVDTIDDAPDASVGTGGCATAGGQCSLRAALQEANNDAVGAPHTVILMPGTKTITLDELTSGEDFAVTGDLDIRVDMTIQSNGDLTIDASSLGDRAFHIIGDIDVTLESTNTGSFDIIGGDESDSGGILQEDGNLNLSDLNINNTGTGNCISATNGNLSVNNVVVDSCANNGIFMDSGTTDFSSDGLTRVEDNAGVGLFLVNSGMTNINRTSVVRNGGDGLWSGGGGTTSIYNSTFALNTNFGISNQNDFMDLNFSTVTQNDIAGTYSNRGINIASDFSMYGSIVYNNSNGKGNCVSAGLITIESMGYNFVGSDLESCFSAGANTGLHSTDVVDIDPMITISPVPDHYVPDTGSPVIDYLPLNDSTCASSPVDYLGRSRPEFGSCDVGAVEVAYDNYGPDFFAIAKSNSDEEIVRGEETTYQVVLTNNESDYFSYIGIVDEVDVHFDNVSWTCTPDGDSTCYTQSGTGNSIDVQTRLAPNSFVTLTITGTLSEDFPEGTISNTSSISYPNSNFSALLPEYLENDTSTVTNSIVGPVMEPTPIQETAEQTEEVDETLPDTSSYVGTYLLIGGVSFATGVYLFRLSRR